MPIKTQRAQVCCSSRPSRFAADLEKLVRGRCGGWGAGRIHEMVIKIDGEEALNRAVTKAGSAVRCGFKSPG